MKILYKFFFNVCFLLILGTSVLSAQTRIAIMGVDTLGERNLIKLSRNESFILSSVPNYAVNFFAGNRKFIVIDKKNQHIVESEKELQKSEGFMDGYMVDQGKSEGVDLIFKPFYNAINNSLIFKVYDIASETVLCAYEKDLKSGFFGTMRLDEQLRYLLHEFSYECLQIQFPVVRASKSNKDQAKTLLVAVGMSNKIKEGNLIEIFHSVTENIDGEEIKRNEIVGIGEIEQINDENFSNVKVTKGGKEIQSALNNGTKLFTRIIKE